VLQVLAANGTDILFSTTLTDDPNLTGESQNFNNGGEGIVGAKFIRLTANNFLHVSEIRANVAAVPEVGTIQTLSVGFVGFLLTTRGRIWLPNSATSNKRRDLT